MGEISGRNSFIWFFWCSTVIGWKSSKTDVIFERSNCNSNAFRVFTRALCSIYRRSFIEIRGGTWGGSLVSRLSWDFLQTYTLVCHTCYKIFVRNCWTRRTKIFRKDTSFDILSTVKISNIYLISIKSYEQSNLLKTWIFANIKWVVKLSGSTVSNKNFIASVTY